MYQEKKNKNPNQKSEVRLHGGQKEFISELNFLPLQAKENKLWLGSHLLVQPSLFWGLTICSKREDLEQSKF